MSAVKQIHDGECELVLCDDACQDMTPAEVKELMDKISCIFRQGFQEEANNGEDF